ncbi:MAG: TIGR03905 family TSCPD domain-containing protein [Coriobacteriaceae bacterium]|jgi:uncharacterized protein (TIGR03905 family)|nr:TIGR03905 family TSCPD domain-containing protein [Coriobacteriaceae bacterium]
MYRYRTKGVCSRLINIELEGERVTHLDFEGGCNGNLKALSILVTGMSIDEAAEKLEGLTCGSRPTSCADQLVLGLREAFAAQEHA